MVELPEATGSIAITNIEETETVTQAEDSETIPGEPLLVAKKRGVPVETALESQPTDAQPRSLSRLCMADVESPAAKSRKKSATGMEGEQLAGTIAAMVSQQVIPQVTNSVTNSVLQAIDSKLNEFAIKQDQKMNQLEEKLSKKIADATRIAEEAKEAAEKRSVMSGGAASSVVGSMLGPTGGTGSYADEMVRRRQEKETNRPSFIEAKGWVRDWNEQQKRNGQMITQDQVDKCYQEMRDKLGDEYKAWIDEEATAKENSGRMLYAKVVLKLKKDVTADKAWRMRTHLHGSLEGLVNMPKGAKIAIEAAPWKRPHLMAVGKCNAALRDLGLDPLMFKIEVGPPETKVILKNSAIGRPVLFAIYTERRGWVVEPEACKEINSSLAAEQVKEALKAA